MGTPPYFPRFFTKGTNLRDFQFAAELHDPDFSKFNQFLKKENFSCGSKSFPFTCFDFTYLLIFSLFFSQRYAKLMHPFMH